MVWRRFWGVLWASYCGLRELRALSADAPAAKLKWAKRVLEFTNVNVKVVGEPRQSGAVVLLGNHLSYLDIPLLLRFAPSLSFVAKQELRKWPVFGEAMEHAGTIFVKRESAESRGQAMEQLQEEMKSHPNPVAIFPSGTTSLNETNPWKSGAFRLAEGAGVPIQAFRIRYSAQRRAAFIGDDAFLSHLWHLCRGGPMEASIEFAEPELVSDLQGAKEKWNEWCRSPASH